MMLERDKIYRARNGSLWRVVCVDAPASESKDGPAIAVGLTKGERYVRRFYPTGMHAECFEGPLDLVAEHREPREWVLSGTNELGQLGRIEDGPRLHPCVVVRVREVLE